jgi:cell division protease FtsH
MSDKIPNLSYYDSTGQDYTFQKPFSESTAELIDAEVKVMIAEQYERAKDLLRKHAEGHNQLAQILLEKEIIYAENLEQIFGKRPWISRSQEILQNEDNSKKNVYDNTENQADNSAKSVPEGLPFPPIPTA